MFEHSKIASIFLKQVCVCGRVFLACYPRPAHQLVKREDRHLGRVATVVCMSTTVVVSHRLRFRFANKPEARLCPARRRIGSNPRTGSKHFILGTRGSRLDLIPRVPLLSLILRTSSYGFG